MHRIFKAMKLDFFTARNALPFCLLAYALGILLATLTKEPMATFVIVMLLTVFMGGMIFSTYEKSHSEKLYGILPLKRSEMIAGRYLYGLIIGLVNIVVAGVIAYVAMQFFDMTFSWFLYWGFAAIAFIYYCFATGFLYPIYFKFSFTKGYLYAMIPMILLGIGVMFFARKSDAMTAFNQFTQFFSDHLFLAPLFGLVCGLVLLTISAVISHLIYSHKEI